MKMYATDYRKMTMNVLEMTPRLRHNIIYSVGSINSSLPYKLFSSLI